MTVGCGGGSASSKDGGRDAPQGDVAKPDTGGGADKPSSCPADGGGARKVAGDTCTCASDCQSGFCVDGVCCNSACTETCMACNTQEMMGSCTPVPAGQKPRTASQCPAADVSTCGIDGTCDGQGACRKYPMGTECKAGSCTGAAVTGRSVCDDKGACVPGDDKVCVPFGCDATKNACFAQCTSNADCTPGHSCVAGSCGPKMKGASCAKNEECASGFCTDGVCCAVECKGACTSCNQVGREGICWPTDEGNPDPHKVCKDSGPTKCGETGTCDGFGGCSKYGPQTVCVLPSCAGDRLNTAGTCDGQGTCKPPGVMECPPFKCVAGACNTTCKSDADCVAGIACVNGSCGPKQDGSACAKGTECKSGNCVDGVCCNEACGGACRSCNLAASKGKCTPIPAGSTDNRNMCKDQGAPSCGTDGRCDGAGGCRKYRVGTVCAGEKCAGNVSTPAATCNATGQCVTPPTRSCVPFACNGTRCFDACTANTNCSAGNVCNGNSCGLKLPGASCSGNAECASNVCAQGVCCTTTCNAACKSCALPNTLGTCTNVPTGAADPKNMCLDQGPASCGNNGRCAAGACQKYAAGTKCKDSTCPAGTVNFTGQSTCDGAGACRTPAVAACTPFACGAAVCKSTCTANADCAPNFTCMAGSCGLKPKGATCGATAECGTGLVCSAQGVCCNAACNGPCVSCTLPATMGTCSPIAAGNADPSGMCTVSDPSTCGNDGKCDGAGACRKYVAGTQCAPPSCPAGKSMQTLAKTCNGTGSCSGGGGLHDCGTFMCDGAMNCRENCTANDQCVTPNTCVGNLCGKKGPGARCFASNECSTGLSCTDGFCCTSADCGDCRACDGTGSCQNVGGSCGVTDMCHQGGMCSAGSCVRPAVDCNDGNPCTVDSCNGTMGCVHTPITNGTACNDGNACTQTDTCQAGTCTGSNPVVCGAAPTCHGAGICNPASGTCSFPNAANGTGCNDGNACTQTDTCQGGTCTGSNPVACGGADECHNDGVCNPANGTCTPQNKPNGTGCNDDNACTQTDTCQGGTCTGSNPKTCGGADECHNNGVCNPADGTCTPQNKPNGTGCDDGNACTQTDTCQGGTCTGGNPKSCGAGDDCHLAGVCNPNTGACVGANKPNGTGCDDGNECTQTDTCQGGTCTGSNPKVCGGADQCHDNGTCNPNNGNCSAPPKKDDGTGCTDNNLCTEGDMCLDGMCIGTPKDCAGGLCDLGICI